MLLLILALVLLWFIGSSLWSFLSLRVASGLQVQQDSFQSVGTLVCSFFVAGLLAEFWGYFVGTLNPFLVVISLALVALPFALQKKDWRLPHFALPQRKLLLSYSFLFVIVAFLCMEILFYTMESPFKRTTDAYAYHFPRIVEWFQRGHTRWIHDSPILRMNYSPRLVHALSTVVLTFTQSIRWSLLPLWIASVGFLLFTMRSLVQSTLKDTSEWSKACAWLAAAVAISIPPVLLQLRAGMVDGAYFGILSAFLAAMAWNGPAELRLLGALMALLLALAQKHTGLISLPTSLCLLLIDRPIRDMLWRRRTLAFVAMGSFFVGCAIFSIEYIENFVQYGNPFYPAPVSIGPIHFPGSGRTISDFGERFVGKTSALANLFIGWKYIFFALISYSEDLVLVDADVGGYGLGIKFMFVPMFVGWLYSLRKSAVVRWTSLRVFLMISTMIVMHKEMDNCHVHTRYYTIAIIPLVLGGCLAFFDGFKQRQRWQWPATIVLSLWLAAAFFKVAGFAHYNYKQELRHLPSTAFHFTPAWAKPAPRPLKILVLASGSLSWNTTSFEYYGLSVRHKVHLREVPIDKPKVDPVGNDNPIFVPQAKEDFANLYNEASQYDVIVMDYQAAPSLQEFYLQIFTQKGWTPIDRKGGRYVFDIDFPSSTSVKYILLSPGLLELEKQSGISN